PSREKARTLLTDCQDDLTKELPTLQVLLGRLCLLKWIGAVNDGDQSALPHECGCLHKLRPCSHLGALHGQLARRDLTEIQLHCTARRRSAGNETTALRHLFDTTVPHLRTDMSDHNINASTFGKQPHPLRHLSSSVMDDRIGTQNDRFRNLVLRPDGGDDSSSGQLRHLDRDTAYSAASSHDQNRFTMLQVRQRK